jgi:hypothetical protein
MVSGVEDGTLQKLLPISLDEKKLRRQVIAQVFHPEREGLQAARTHQYQLGINYGTSCHKLNSEKSRK